MTRVLLLGDSFTEAGAVSEESSVRAVLERLLNAQGCGRYEVLNGGTSGYSTDQEYLFFEREGARYAPDVVVLLFFSNDLQGNTTTRKKPWFEADGACRLQLRNSPVPAPSDDRWRRSPDPPADLAPWRGSQALRLLGLRTERATPSLQRALARLGLVSPAADHPPTRDWLLSCGPDSALTDRRWHVTLCLIDALHASVCAHGASFVVLYVPAGFEFDERVWGRTRDRWGLDGEGWDAGRVATRLEAACRRWGIPFVDPRPALARARSEGGQAYFAADPHWTDVGHASAASALAPSVRSLTSCGTQVAFTPAPARK